VRPLTLTGQSLNTPLATLLRGLEKRVRHRYQRDRYTDAIGFLAAVVLFKIPYL
jgi:hypothetical protein